MLYNICFQDNIYILLRQIDTVNNGLKLELDTALFGEKIILDLVFFDKAIKKLFSEIQKQKSLPNFVDILQCLHFCIAKYLELLSHVLLQENMSKGYVKDNWSELLSVTKEQKAMLSKLEEHIERNESALAQQEMVSTNELTELLSISSL